MKTQTTMYQALLAAQFCDAHASLILRVLNISQDLPLPFEPGRLLMTDGVQALQDLGMLDGLPYLIRHLLCDWGNLDLAEWAINQQALQNGEGLSSVYYSGANDEVCLFIRTAPSRTHTVMLLADEFDCMQDLHNRK
ncbi:hypothetical protein [Pseudomonas vanderleydeniana]|uniref:Uncharacterized protein n=1 Tax=Pseudomonas vanderleydeniana TaxID=2745495 RepID=A0A9E6PGZ9_9PSED|nr:hypothetical protein [Pseudomonas vanderleydeniana]QXI26252.1 hypothetical protein HU752_020095 [Pseudomonas vanderleydeniana]